MSEWPFVSIIVVNYNGAHYLGICLPALRSQNYPAERFEVIVSDNRSSDVSLSLLSEKFGWVKVIKNSANLGFATGNNVAVRQAQGDFIIFMNNDTAPQSDWISQMVKAAQQYPKAGLVTGHMQLFYDELEVTLESETFSFPGDPRELGVQVHGVESGTPRGVVQYKEGFYGWEAGPGGQRFRWCQAKAVLGIPVPTLPGGVDVKLKLAVAQPAVLVVRLKDEVLARFEVNDAQPQEYAFHLREAQRKLAFTNEQNTGSIIFKNGMGRDRGTFVRGTESFFERDEGRYALAEEVFAGCGGSLLLRRETLEDVGSFDDRFFMYYEDTDLCWRAWLKGWTVMYAPDARIRHIHSGTTKEWSPFFLYLIERNRLEMIFKNGPWPQLFKTWGGFGFKTIRTGLIAVYQTLLQRHGWRQNAKSTLIYLRVLANLLLLLPVLIVERIKIQSNRRVSHESLRKWFRES